MSDQIDSLDILNLLPLPAKSEDTIALRAEVGELSARLTHMLQSAPSQDDDEHIPEKEEWLKTFSDVKVAKRLTLARDNKVVIDLLVSARQDWQKGDLLCVAFQSQVTAFKDGAVTETADTSTNSTTSTTATGPPPITTTTTAPAIATPTASSTEDVPAMGKREEGADQEQETQEQTEEESEETNEQEDPEQPSGWVGQKKQTLCMSAGQLNPVPCMTCTTMHRECHNGSKGQSCYECYHGKVKCSLVQNKGKKKVMAPPHSPPPPPLSSHLGLIKGQPGPQSIQNNTYVELWMSMKQKVAAVEEKESGSEDGEEEAYLASWVSGLSNILQMIEMACATMRKEVEEINRQVTKRCHCCR
ncbi:hypothetical protein BDR06DRAFT_1002926 [Suillus hirtellus]|nr:hypothetical protein BDR06DRAFT_1002926 [Suillus hirtellus]